MVNPRFPFLRVCFLIHILIYCINQDSVRKTEEKLSTVNRKEFNRGK
jgi:hypothetical protein